MTRLLAAWLLVASVLGCGGDADDYRPLQAGDRAPDYAAATLGDDTVSLASLRGRPVLLNIWASWCLPCRHEMPALQELDTRYAPQGLEVVAVSIDDHRDDAAAFAEELELTLLVLHDPAARITRSFRTTGVPESFLVDADGRIVRRWIGAFDPLSDATLAVVEQTLTATPP